MVGKKSAKALQVEEGLERTDNGMKLTSFPEVSQINQKNYYTEYMKRDDQILPLRLQAEASRDKMIRTAKDKDRALARTGDTDVPGPNPDEPEFGDEDASTGADGFDASKIIAIHLGSQNMRIGLASDALPRTVPMCTAWKMPKCESDIKPPLPKRQKMTGTPEEQFGDEWAKKYGKMCDDLKKDMRINKRKVLPNSKELVVNYNRRTPPEKIPEHNDPARIEWTDVTLSSTFNGLEAQRIPDNSDPPFRLFWPIQHGRLNEEDFPSKEQLKMAIDSIITGALKTELKITKTGQWKDYSCVLVIPDLYDKKFVEMMLEMFMNDYSFAKVAFIQESLAASFGAGYTSACIVDVGAQKTSICCVEDGLCIEDSRINLKYGGYDVTETFVKMMLFDHFPYADINLVRRYDFLLAEELKMKFCTMNQAEISVQLYNFHLRAPSEYTRKYNFKTYDEVILAPMGFCDPSIFDNSTKLNGRRKLIDRSYNIYDPEIPDDPVSAAQISILAAIKPSAAAVAKPPATVVTNGEGTAAVSTPMKEKPNPFSFLGVDAQGTPGTSHAGSPAPEGSNTPAANGGSPAPFQFGGSGINAPQGIFVPDLAQCSQRALAAERDSVLPIAPLDTAILTSITTAARGDEKKLRDLLGGIMMIGGGAKTPGFGPFLEERLKRLRPDLGDRILVGTSPREMDGQVVTWKGASVFAKLVGTNDTWIGGTEWERLGSRVLHHKLAFYY
ncbi:hypothetical protein V493_06432 [Pseudogymnoascus sp. VKM F-4281 (FW-2241)]|nr:hypothetical protein V493_06432 [Pseudogymnoascus sp. VKM F-4281 (FW-2241)]